MTAVREGHIDLWLLRQPDRDAVTGTLDLSELDDSELNRTSLCRRKPNGFLYTSAHIALRRLLGAYLDVPPRDLRFVREPCPGCGEPHGRPAVSTPSPPLHFSLSHSTGMVMIGVAATPIGVDVEKLPGPETVEMCTPAFHPAERAELESLPDEARRAAFGQLWTRKEAYLKALGTGLSRALDADYLGGDPARHPAGWTVLDTSCGPGHTAAAAVLGVTPTSVGRRWLRMEWLYEGGAVDITAGAHQEPVTV